MFVYNNFVLNKDIQMKFFTLSLGFDVKPMYTLLNWIVQGFDV
jgi:hypothetical protein